MNTTLCLLKHLADLSSKPVPEFTCPLIDRVLSQVRWAQRQMWDLEKKSPSELCTALRTVEECLNEIPGLMEQIRFANSELREVAEPAATLATSAKLMLSAFREKLTAEEKLTLEQMDDLLDAITASDEIGNEDDDENWVESITYLSRKAADGA